MLALPERLTGHQSWHSLDGVGWERIPPRFVLIEPPHGGYWRQVGSRLDGAYRNVCYMPSNRQYMMGISWWVYVKTRE